MSGQHPDRDGNYYVYQSVIPKDAVRLPGTPLRKVYSNFDHEIDKDIAKELELQNGKVWAAHTAQNFFGHVWYVDGKWYNEIWIHNSPRSLISGKTLRHVISEANQEFGSC